MTIRGCHFGAAVLVQLQHNFANHVLVGWSLEPLAYINPFPSSQDILEFLACQPLNIWNPGFICRTLGGKLLGRCD